jgi:hypothetical protein
MGEEKRLKNERKRWMEERVIVRRFAELSGSLGDSSGGDGSSLVF